MDKEREELKTRLAKVRGWLSFSVLQILIFLQLEERGEATRNALKALAQSHLLPSTSILSSLKADILKELRVTTDTMVEAALARSEEAVKAQQNDVLRNVLGVLKVRHTSFAPVHLQLIVASSRPSA